MEINNKWLVAILKKKEKEKIIKLYHRKKSKKKIAKRERGAQELQVSFCPVSLTWRWQTRDFAASITV